MTAKRTEQIDARGLLCPWPAIRLSRAMRDRETAEILVDDPKAASEIAALSDQQGWRREHRETDHGVSITVSRHR